MADRTPRSRKTYHHGDLATALVDAADELIADQGIAGFSLREAARRVGVDPAACYRHFRDREAIIQALARRGFTRLAHAFADLVHARRRKPAVEVVRALGHAYVQFALDAPSAFRCMFGPNGYDARDPTLRGDYRDGIGGYERVLRAVAAWCETDGLALDHEAAALAMWSAVHGFASMVLDGALRFNHAAARERAVDDILTTVIAGLTVRGREGKARSSRG